MKVNPRLLGLMVALAAGSAYAAPTGTSAGTLAGTAINNTATATFTDPTATGNGTAQSNSVVSTVNAITGFDVLYQDSSPDDTSATAPAATYKKANVVPGTAATPTKVNTLYTVVNNSNIAGYVVKLDSVRTTTSAVSFPDTAVEYFLADANGAPTGTALTSVTLDAASPTNDGAKNIVQVITIPLGSSAGNTFAASPRGSAPASSDAAAYVPGTNPAPASFSQYDEATNQNTAGTPATNGDLQYTLATIVTPTLDATPTTPTTNTVVPPTTANPGTPNNPVSPPNTPPGVTPNPDPTDLGYTSPDPTNPINPTNPANPGTSVVVDVAGNNQTAYPPTGVTSVAFQNEVKNGTAIADTVKLFPANGTAPAATPDSTGKFSYTAPNGDAVTVQFFDATTGSALPVGADNYPILTVAPNSTANYYTVVTYTPTTTNAANPTNVVIPVGINSGNKTQPTTPVADTTTTDTIVPSGLAFRDVGNTTALDQIGPSNAAQVVDVSKSASTAPITDAGTNTDRTAVFPMLISNTGEYADTYLLDSNTPTFGTTTTAPVKYYYDKAGTTTELPKDGNGKYFTPVVAANSTLTVYAVVDVPTDAIAGDYTFAQKATANFSGAVLTDTNDTIRVSPVNTGPAASGIEIQKYQAKGTTTAGTTLNLTPSEKGSINIDPKQFISYAIVAKNNFNAPVKQFILKDITGSGPTLTPTNIYTFSDYQSASVTLTGFTGTPTVYYSTDSGTTWSGTAPAANTAANPTVTATNGLQVFVDTDNSGTLTNADLLPIGASIQLNIDVKVK